jgi:hypothetical protein
VLLTKIERDPQGEKAAINLSVIFRSECIWQSNSEITDLSLFWT